MAMTVRAWCAGCARQVSVPLSDVVLMIPEPSLAPRCVFCCPQCGSERSVTTSDEIADILLTRGVVAERVDVVEPSRHADGPPICYDDILELHLALAAL